MAKLFIDELELVLGNIAESGESSLGEGVVEKIEWLISESNQANLSETEQLIPDSIYDFLVETLKSVKPESNLLSELWEDTGEDTGLPAQGTGDESVDQHLARNPMLSIQTIKAWGTPELEKFYEVLEREEFPELFCSYKINGHGIRVVYKDGVLIKAYSRARASEGRDLTRQMINILGEECDALSQMGVVEIRGEVALPVNRLEEARKFNPELKSAFSAVSSLLKPSSTLEENLLLGFYAYAFYCDGHEGLISTKEDEYNFLLEAGFQVPGFFVLEDKYDILSVEDLLKSVVYEMESGYEAFGLFCDGVVVQINDMASFRMQPLEGKYSLGNVALKVGLWEQNLYSGVVRAIEFTKGKSKRSPVALVGTVIEGEVREDGLFDLNGDPLVSKNGLHVVDGIIIEEGVLTSQGNRVRRVPLYEPRNILRLDAYPGEGINFRYGGEAGVVPCFPDGRLLTEDAVQNLLGD